MLGNIVVIEGIQHDQIVLPAGFARAFHEHPPVLLEHLDPLIRVKAEELPRDLHHRRIDLDHVDPGIGEHLDQRRRQHASPQTDYQDLAGMGIQIQRAHHHPGISEDELVGIVQGLAGLPGGLIAPAETHAPLVVFFVDDDVPVKRFFGVDDGHGGGRRGRERSEQSEQGLEPIAWAHLGSSRKKGRASREARKCRPNRSGSD